MALLIWVLIIWLIAIHISVLEVERDAAYARGLEDAAKVADEVEATFTHADDTMVIVAYEIAAAIRALKPGDNKLKQGEADAPAKSE